MPWLASTSAKQIVPLSYRLGREVGNRRQMRSNYAVKAHRRVQASIQQKYWHGLIIDLIIVPTHANFFSSTDFLDGHPIT